jgi:hypothetical protein
MREHAITTVRQLLEMAGKSYEQRLRGIWGVTDSPHLGGYLLPDGDFLDFSQGSGHRAADHRQIEGVVPSKWRKGNKPRGYRWDDVVHVSKKIGMFRWVPESWHITLWTKPTRDQLRTIKKLAGVRDLMVAIDYRGKKVENYDYTTHDAEQIIADIKQSFGM